MFMFSEHSPWSHCLNVVLNCRLADFQRVTKVFKWYMLGFEPLTCPSNLVYESCTHYAMIE